MNKSFRKNIQKKFFNKKNIDYFFSNRAFHVLALSTTRFLTPTCLLGLAGVFSLCSPIESLTRLLGLAGVFSLCSPIEWF